MGVFENNTLAQQAQEDFWKKSSNRFSDQKDNLLNKELTGVTSFANRLTNSTYLNNTNSKAIQPVIKIISKQTGLTQVRRLLDYITREAKPEDEHLVIESDEMKSYHTKEEREQLINEWKEDFANKEKYQKQEWKLEILEQLEKKRTTLNQIPDDKLLESQKVEIEKLTDQIDNKYTLKKVKDKKTGLWKQVKQDLKVRVADDTSHVLLSVGGMPDEKKATQAVRKFLKDNLSASGFKYIFVKHADTNNLHYHVSVKNKSVFGKNLRFDKADLFVLRQEFARSLSIQGIERVATLRKDRTEILEKVKKDITNIKERDSWYQNQLKKDPESHLIKDKSRNFDVFSYRAGLLKQTQYLADKIKIEIKNYNGKDKESLKEDLKYIKSFQQEIKTQTPEKVKIAKDKTISYLSRENKTLISKFQELNIDKGQTQEKTLSASQKRRRNKYLNTLMKKHIADLKQARKIVLVNKDTKSNTEKEKHQQSIKILDLMIKNSKNVGKGRGFGF